MALFRKQPQPSSSHGARGLLGSGRALQSELPLNDCLRILKVLVFDNKPPEFKHFPAYVYPGWVWNKPHDEAPTKVVSFYYDGDFLLAAFWPGTTGTKFSLIPLGDGLERLSLMPIIGHWKQKDRSLTSVGHSPSGAMSLTVPPISDKLFSETLDMAGFPPTPSNIQILGLQFGEMFLVKSYEYISSESSQLADHFTQAHDYNGGPVVVDCQTILNDLAAWNPQVVPYIQDLPMRIRAILLEPPAEGGAPLATIWDKLAR